MIIILPNRQKTANRSEGTHAHSTQHKVKQDFVVVADHVAVVNKRDDEDDKDDEDDDEDESLRHHANEKRGDEPTPTPRRANDDASRGQGRGTTTTTTTVYNI